MIYKIATAQAFAPARTAPVFAGMPIDLADGYLHFSTAEQLPETLRLYFAGQRDLVLLAVRSADLGAALKWETSRGGALFPHLFGVLPTRFIAWEASIWVTDDGACQLPEGVR